MEKSKMGFKGHNMIKLLNTFVHKLKPVFEPYNLKVIMPQR